MSLGKKTEFLKFESGPPLYRQAQIEDVVIIMHFDSKHINFVSCLENTTKHGI